MSTIKTNARLPCRLCGTPTTTAVPGPQPVCLTCQDASTDSLKDQLRQLGKVSHFVPTICRRLLCLDEVRDALEDIAARIHTEATTLRTDGHTGAADELELIARDAQEEADKIR